MEMFTFIKEDEWSSVSQLKEGGIVISSVPLLHIATQHEASISEGITGACRSGGICAVALCD